jgi:hypothetical protein
MPTCVGAATTVKTHVKLGVVRIEADEGSTWDQVVWLQCLE